MCESENFQDPVGATSLCAEPPPAEMCTTLDHIQRTHSCSLEGILLWSEILIFRFNQMTTLKDVNITIQYFDSNNTSLHEIEQSPQSLPDSVEKIILRAIFNEQKNVTVTLYLKYKSNSGTILVQGKGCPEWANKEFPILEAVVSNTTSSSDYPWREEVQAVPMYFGTGAPIMPPPATEGKVCSAPTQVLLSSPQSAESCEQTAVKQRHALSPPRTKRNLRRRATISSPVCSRVRNRAKPSPGVTVSVLNRLTQLQLDLEELSTDQHQFQTQVQCLAEDMKTSTKNELRPIIATKCDNIMHCVETLEARITNLEKQNIQLQKENQSLKTQVGTLNANIKKLKPKTMTDADTQTQYTAVTVSQQVNAPSSSSPTPSPTHNDKVQDSTQSTSPVTPTPLIEPPHYSVSTSNSFSTLAEETVPMNRQESQKESPQDNSTPQHADSNTYSKRSPQEQLSQIAINKRTTAVLVGDSVIRTIDSQRLSQTDLVCQKVCVPGATVGDVHTWLSQLPIHPSVHVVTVHVGVNSCPCGQVTEREWTDLIAACQRVFPRALIRLSSILPARGRHNLNNTISPSNKHLAAVCERRGTVFINNHSTFTALSGAPRLDLYKDATHPSAKGTAKLAVNLRLDSHQSEQFSRPSPDSVYHHSHHRNVRSCARYPHLHRKTQGIQAIPNPHTPIHEQPPPPSMYHYPPLPTHSNPSFPPPPLPIQPWYSTEESLPASVEWNTARPDGPVRHPGNPSACSPPRAFPQPASAMPNPDQLHHPSNSSACPPAASHPGPARVTQRGPPGPLHPLAVHFLNMAAQMCGQQTAVY